MNNSYIPMPIDTTEVILSPELMALAERLAENTHDIWASERIKQGWSYGPQRDDAALQTPCLVPYSNLPEGEKIFDRSTALQTIRLLILFGWTLTPPTS